MVGAPVEDQPGQDADPQAALHQGHHRVVVPHPVADPGLEALPAQEVLHRLVVLRRKENEIFLRQILEADGPAGCQGVALRQDGHEVVLHQLDEVQVRRARVGGEAQVHDAAAGPVRDLRRTAQLQLELDLGVAVPEVPQPLGKPVAGEAGKGPDAHHPGLHVLQPAELLLEALLAVEQLPQGGQEDRTFHGRDQSGLFPAEEGNAQLLLRGLEDLADPGGGVGKILRRAGQALQFRDFGDNFIRWQVHKFFSHPLLKGLTLHFLRDALN